MRLNRFLAAAGLGSRRGTEELIRDGRISVNGRVSTDLGQVIDVRADQIALDGERVRLETRWVYLVLHKPAGFVTTRSDELGRKTIEDLLGRWRGRVAPVGRLDRASEGLLLLTNNGELAHRLLHPRYHQPRTYLVWTSPRPTAEMLREIERGVTLGRGERSGRAEVKVLGRGEQFARIRITLREGKNREVRRIFRHFGLHVTALRRIAYANVELGTLPPGSLRLLSRSELDGLARVTGLTL